MKDNEEKSGIGFMGMLGIVFIALKLMDFIHWPWLWVLSPLWLVVASWIIVLTVLCILAVRQ